MSALPIIGRELRVRARRKSTFWLRVIAALLASLTAASTLSWTQYQTWGPWRPGKTLFDTLSALAFIFCLVEGVRQTADCLSQEKRDGTLGLLFLTELSGFDVVLGKLVAASLGSFYALLAVFPPMAAALPAGGLTAGEFWRTQLVLLNTLFLALACGLWASARHREENRAFFSGMKLAFAITVLPAVLEFLLRRLFVPSLSPGVAMHLAGDTAYVTQPSRFWLTLLSIHLLGWTLLALAGRKLSQTWRDDTEESMEPLGEKKFTEANKENEGSESFAGARASGAAPAESVRPTAPPPASLPSVNEHPEPALQPTASAWPYIDTGTTDSPAPPRINTQPAMESDPAAWLAARSPAHQKLITISILVLALASPMLLFWAMLPGFGGVSSAIYQATGSVPLLLLAFVSSRPLSEARRTGSLELLLATPLSPEAIVRGHWQALWRQLRGPTNIALILLTIFFVLSMTASLSGTWRTGMPGYTLQLFLQCGQRLLGAFVACWLGLYLGLRTRTTMMAVGQNLLCVVAVPWIGGSLFWLIVRLLGPVGIFGTGLGLQWGLQFIWLALQVGYLWWLLRWSQRQLFTRFRELATQP